MTREGAKRHIKALVQELGRPLTKTEKDALTIAYNSMDKLDAIRRCTPPGDDWEQYADRLWDLAVEKGKGHGEWVKDRIGMQYPYRCTKCDNHHRAMYNYCPSCGAKMEEDNT